MNERLDKVETLFAIGLLMSFIMITYGFGRNIFPMIIPDMKKSFGFTYTAVGIITALHQIAYLGFSYISGKLTIKVNATLIVGGSVIVSGICLILIGIIDNFWVIGFLFVITGACAAASWVPMIDVVGRFVPDEHLSKSMGFIASGTSYGVFLSGFAVPYIKRQYGWEMIWIVFGIFAICIFIIWLFSFSLILANDSKSTTKVIKSQKASLGKMKSKVIQIMALMFLTGLALIPFQTYLIPYMREELQLSLELGGRVWNIIGLLGMISGLIVGTIADRITIRRALLIAYLLILISSALLFLYPTTMTVLLSGLLFGVAYFGIFGLIPTYIHKMISKELSSSIFGITNLALGLGSAIGNYLAGMSKAMIGSFSWIYMTICCICFALILVAFNLENEKHTIPQTGDLINERRTA